MLLAHVLNLHLQQRAVGQRLGEHVSGDVRVDVDLDYLVVVDHYHAVAERLEVSAEQRGVLAVFAPDYELGAVGKRDLARGEVREIRPLARLVSLLLPLNRDKALTPEHRERGFEYEEIALAARVDHSGALEHGIQVYRVRQGLRRGFASAAEHQLKVAAVLGELQRRAGGNARNGEYRALRRLHDGLVRRVHAGAHRLGIKLRVRRLAALQPLRKAAEKQREYDAGVAARAAEHGVCRAGGGLAQRRESFLRELRRRGAHRQAHVRARVPVRDREDVQLVYELLVLSECGVCALYDLAEKRRVNEFSQEGLYLRTSFSLYIRLSRLSSCPHIRPRASPARRWPWRPYS